MRRFEVVSDEFRKFPDSKIILPTRATIGSAGYDFCTPIDFVMDSGKLVKIHTDIKAKVPNYEVLMLYIRSSLGIKKNIQLANLVGIIDSDYYNNLDNDGNIILALINKSFDQVFFKAGDKLAQGIFMSYQTVDDESEAELLKTRHGGIGSTGK